MFLKKDELTLESERRFFFFFFLFAAVGDAYQLGCTTWINDVQELKHICLVSVLQSGTMVLKLFSLRSTGMVSNLLIYSSSSGYLLNSSLSISSVESEDN